MKHLIAFVLALLAVCLPATAQLRFTKIVTNLTDLRALDTRDIHKAIYVRGFTTSGDGGEGIFVADEASIEPHYPGMVETNIGPGRFIRHFDRPEFPATWFGTPVDNSVLNSAISWASSNGFGYVIMPLGDTAVDPITNAVTLKDNVSLIWPPGANWVVDHVPATNWTLLSVVGVTNFGLYSPSLVGVTNIPGDILNFGRLITILSSTNGFILDPKLEAEYSDAIYWGEDLSTNANQNVTVSGANQGIMDANAGTRLAADLNYRRVTNLVELSLSDVSKQNLLMEVYSQSDTNITGFWQYDPDNADSTNATDTVALINFSGRFKKIASAGGGGAGGISGVSGSGTVPHIPYWSGPTNLADSQLAQYSDVILGWTNAFSLFNDGGIFLGINTSNWWGGPPNGAALVAYSDVSLGDPVGREIDLASELGATNGYFKASAVAGSAYAQLSASPDGGTTLYQSTWDSRTFSYGRNGQANVSISPDQFFSAPAPYYFNYDGSSVLGTNFFFSVDYYLTNTFRIANDAVYPDDATKYFDGTGHWSTPVGSGGITINATDGVMPYRSGSTTLADSPIKRVTADRITPNTPSLNLELFNDLTNNIVTFYRSGGLAIGTGTSEPFSGGIQLNGMFTAIPQDFTADAASFIPGYSIVRVIGNGGAITLTNLPTMGASWAQDGTRTTIIGRDNANTVTFQDAGTLPGSKLKLRNTTRTLAQYSILELVYILADDLWIETNFVP